jgi:hypothetical protein
LPKEKAAEASSGDGIPKPKPKHSNEKQKLESAPPRKVGSHKIFLVYNIANIFQQEGISFDPRENYIVVEEEISEEEPKPRGRKREKIIVEEYDGPNRPPSPSDSRAYPRRAHSAAEKQEIAHATQAQVKHHRRRPPSSGYTRVEVPSRYYDAEYGEVVGLKESSADFIEEVKYEGPVPVTRGHHKENESQYPRKIPVRYVEGVRKPVRKTAEPHQEEQPGGHSRFQEYIVEEAESVSTGSRNRHYPLDERSTSTREHPDWEHAHHDHSSLGSRSTEARRRRRRERIIPEVQPWEASHIIDPETTADVILVTERYEYRKPRHNEETRRTQEYVDRTQEYIDRTTLDAHHEPRRFSPDDAARYFNDDWAASEIRSHTQPPVRQPAPRRQSHRKDRMREPSLSSETSYDYTISRGKDLFICCIFYTNDVVGNPLPRAPTPPSPLEQLSEVAFWETRHPQHLDTEELRERVGQEEMRASQRSRESEREASRASQRSRQGKRARSTSIAHSEHERTRQAEPATTPSPPRSRERLTVISEGSVADSGMTERERMAELGTRHVTFRDTPSERSAAAWPSHENSPTGERGKFDSGWDNGDGGGAGSW